MISVIGIWISVLIICLSTQIAETGYSNVLPKIQISYDPQDGAREKLRMQRGLNLTLRLTNYALLLYYRCIATKNPIWVKSKSWI